MYTCRTGVGIIYLGTSTSTGVRSRWLTSTWRQSIPRLRMHIYVLALLEYVSRSVRRSIVLERPDCLLSRRICTFQSKPDLVELFKIFAALLFHTFS